MELPKRKPNRLSYYDYSAPGAYFITICTKNRRNLFWVNAGQSVAHPQLSRWGNVVQNAICSISKHYPAVSVDLFAIMPNHIHLLLQINTNADGRAMLAPTISTVIQQFKGSVTKQIGQSVWQKLFHDHVIRNAQDYLKILEYIDNNPARWTEDCFYMEEAQ